jgi:hypothetical protein
MSSPKKKKKKTKNKTKNKTKKSKLIKSVNNLDDSKVLYSEEESANEKDIISKSNPFLKLKKKVKKKKKKKKMTKKEKLRLKKLKKIRLKKLKEKRKKEKKLRMKKKFKQMLKKFLEENPWKNKNMFEGRQDALREYKRRGTLPGVRLAKKLEKSCCNRHNHDHDPILHEKPPIKRYNLLGRGSTLQNIKDPIFNGNS